MTFSYRSRVEWMDTDAAGIYHNSTVVRFVESAEAALVREWGLGSVYFPRVPRVRWPGSWQGRLRWRCTGRMLLR